MLFCLVIVGDYHAAPKIKKFIVPPNRPDGEPHDSVCAANGSHFIIYDNNKQFPCYLITFE